MSSLQNHRYGTEDLEFFRSIIEKKLNKAQEQLKSLEEQLDETTANKNSESDFMDDSSSSASLQLLDTMAHRLRKHIIDLQNALLRVENRSYGVCSITGELIDKNRLTAVPTTTKCLAAKTGNAAQLSKKIHTGETAKKPKKSKIISRVVTPKSVAVESRPIPLKDDDEWDETDSMLEDVEKIDLPEEEMED